MHREGNQEGHGDYPRHKTYAKSASLSLKTTDKMIPNVSKLLEKLKMAEPSPAIFLKPDIATLAFYANMSAVIPLYQPILSS